MRILAIADIHGAVGVYEWLVGLAQKQHVGVLVLAGDLLLGGWEEEQREQAENTIIPLLKNVPLPVFYLMGNDDHSDLDYDDGHIKSLHNRRLDIDGQSFVGYQYSPPFMGGIFEKPEQEIERDCQALEHLLDEKTVFVTHSPAYGAADVTYAGDHVGSTSLAALLKRKPVLAHIHGHIHPSFGRDGRHFNVAAAGRRRAMLIEIPSLHYTTLQSE